jgi:hypothetical protein
MTRPYSLAFKQKMVERLTGKNPLNQSQLARETGFGSRIYVGGLWSVFTRDRE